MKKEIIDLNGPMGNAFVLMGRAMTFGKLKGMSKEEIDQVLQDMQSGDYDNLLKVFKKNFSKYATLIGG